MSRRLRILAASLAMSQSEEWQAIDRGPAEFHFVRLEYVDLPGMNRGGYGRGWWRQDRPEAEMPFAQGILMRVRTRPACVTNG